MKKRTYYFINGITLYRLVAAPVLIALIFLGKTDLFKWLLPVSFFTDAIDGYLARKFKVKSILGAKLDSIADDLTILAAIIGLFVLKPEFIKEELKIIIVMFVLYLSQIIFSFIRYGKLSGFHTYIAKVAAVFQGMFLILIFLTPEPLYALWYVAALLTILDLIEEIILVSMLPKWEANVKGLFWVIKRKRPARRKIKSMHSGK
jgi:CDP-diacylglycerol--glycerol-3-phosphate 3-phosphatidyltransferase